MLHRYPHLDYPSPCTISLQVGQIPLGFDTSPRLARQKSTASCNKILRGVSWPKAEEAWWNIDLGELDGELKFEYWDFERGRLSMFFEERRGIVWWTLM